MEKNTGDTEKLKKVVVIGPECSGKTTLSEALARHYNTTWVPEYAREYIDQLPGPYKASDLLTIAKGQIRSEEDLKFQSDRLLICDTDLIIIKVWSEHKYGTCHKEILEQIAHRKYDLYLLTAPDIPWDDDPQRENPKLREYFYRVFKAELEQRHLPFIEINGNFSSRLNKAIKSIDAIIGV